MVYVMEALVAAVPMGWMAREFVRAHNYRASCAARLRRHVTG
ncbi:MAG: hypothetical protein U1E16_00590 [Hyphomicrobiales bacterium]